MTSNTQIANKAILKKSETKYMARIPQKELIDAMNDLSIGAYKLLMYYYSRKDGWRFVDENIAKVLETSVRQLKKFRKELIDQKYLLIQKGEVDVYFIGRIAVDRFVNELSEIDSIDEEPTNPLLTKGN